MEGQKYTHNRNNRILERIVKQNSHRLGWTACFKCIGIIIEDKLLLAARTERRRVVKTSLKRIAEEQNQMVNLQDLIMKNLKNRRCRKLHQIRWCAFLWQWNTVGYIDYVFIFTFLCVKTKMGLYLALTVTILFPELWTLYICLTWKSSFLVFPAFKFG